MTLLLDAQKLSNLGFDLLFCNPMKKTPIDKDWLTKKLTFDELVLKHTDGQNLAIKLGETYQNFFLHCVDLSVEDPSAKYDAYQALTKHFPNSNFLPTVMTPKNGGQHHYFFSRTQLKTKKLAQAVETIDKNGERVPKWSLTLLGKGEYALLPPSTHPLGGQYRWTSQSLTDPFNEAWVILDSQVEKLNNAVIHVDSMQSKQVEDLKYVKFVLDELDKDEWLNDSLGFMKLAYALFREYQGAGKGSAALLVLHNFAKLSEDYEEEDVDKMWESFKIGTPEFKPVTVSELFKEVGMTPMLELNSAIATAQSYEGALRSVARMSLSDVQFELAVEKLKSKSDKLHGEKFLTATSIKKSLTKAQKEEKKKIAAQQRLKNGVGFEDTLAREVIRQNFSFHDGTLTLKQIGINIWTWNEGVWRICERTEIESKAYKTIAALLEPIKKKEDDSDLRKHLKGRLMEDGHADKLNQLANAVSNTILKLVNIDNYNDPLNLSNMKRGASDSYMPFKNGVLYFNEDGTHEFKDHHPSSMVAYQLNSSFNPAASCDKWKAFMKSYFSKSRDAAQLERHFQECMGYILQSSRRQKVFFITKGPTNCGKSLVLGILEYLLGPDGTDSTPLSTYMTGKDSHAEAYLLGKSLIKEDDWNRHDILPDGFIKKLSEGKNVSANPKGGSKFAFYSRICIFINTNWWPWISDTSKAIRERAQVFEVANEIPYAEQDIRLFDLLKEEEAEGIMVWALEGWKRVLARGGYFSVPEGVKESVDGWFSSRIPVPGFIKAHYHVSKNPADKVPRQELYNKFVKWATEEGIVKLEKRNTFYENLRENGFIEEGDCFIGLRDKNFVPRWDITNKFDSLLK